jgi:hypothetical protein
VAPLGNNLQRTTAFWSEVVSDRPRVTHISDNGGETADRTLNRAPVIEAERQAHCRNAPLAGWSTLARRIPAARRGARTRPSGTAIRRSCANRRGRRGSAASAVRNRPAARMGRSRPARSPGRRPPRRGREHRMRPRVGIVTRAAWRRRDRPAGSRWGPRGRPSDCCCTSAPDAVTQIDALPARSHGRRPPRRGRCS